MTLKKYDHMVGFAFLLMVVAHASTNYLIWSHRQVAESLNIAQDVVNVYEANPLARWFFGIERGKLIYSLVIMPSLFIGIYYYITRKYKTEPLIAESLALMVLLMAVLNATNDVSILLGYLAGS